MRHMGWSYQELCDAPAQVVDDVVKFMNLEASSEHARAKHQQMLAEHGRAASATPPLLGPPPTY